MSDSTRLSLTAFSARSEIEPIDPSLVPFLVREITVAQHFQVAIITVLVYDAGEFLVLCLQSYSSHQVITLDKEVSGISHAHEQRFQHTAWPLGKIFLGEPAFLSSVQTANLMASTV